MGFFDELRKESEKAKDEVKPLLGKCFQFKENYDDEDFTYIKIISVRNFGGLMVDKFKKDDEDRVSIRRTYETKEAIHNMTEIPKAEFLYQTGKWLDILNLKHKEIIQN